MTEVKPDTPKLCPEPNCGLEMEYYPGPRQYICPSNADAHALCAKLAAAEAKVRELESKALAFDMKIGHEAGFKALLHHSLSYAGDNFIRSMHHDEEGAIKRSGATGMLSALLAHLDNMPYQPEFRAARALTAAEAKVRELKEELAQAKAEGFNAMGLLTTLEENFHEKMADLAALVATLATTTAANAALEEKLAEADESIASRWDDGKGRGPRDGTVPYCGECGRSVDDINPHKPGCLMPSVLARIASRKKGAEHGE